MKKLASILLSITMILGLSATTFATENDNYIRNESAEYTTTELPVAEMERMNITLQLSPTRRSLNETFLSRVFIVHEDGISVIDTYETMGLLRADKNKSVTSYGSFTASNGGSTSIEWYVTGQFYYNETDNTAYCRSESGKITKNTYTIGPVSSGTTVTSQGGGALGSKRWAEAKFSFTRTTITGSKSNHHATARVDSAGKETKSDS